MVICREHGSSCPEVELESRLSFMEKVWAGVLIPVYVLTFLSILVGIPLVIAFELTRGDH